MAMKTTAKMPWSRKLAIAVAIAAFLVPAVLGFLRIFSQVGTVVTGEVGKLYVKEAPFLTVAVNELSLEDFYEKPKTDDEGLEMFAKLTQEQRIFPVELNTTVRVTEVRNSHCHVVITSGKESGRDGWVPCGWIVLH